MSIFDTPHRNAMPEFQRSQTVLPAVAIQRIESNLLPELRVPNLILKKDEACRFVDKSYRNVETTTTHRVRHSGGISTPSLLFKGVRYHTGTSSSTPITEVHTQYIPGYLYITDKRILFTAKEHGFEKSLQALSSFTPYSNAVGMQFGQTVIHFILPRTDLAIKTLQMVTRI